jgi:hypothetical protein
MLAAVISAAAVTSPSAPTQVTASATPGQVQLTWKPPAVTQATVITYLVTVDDESTGAVSAPMASSDGAEPEDTITGLTAGDSFDFTVQARTTDGEGEASAPSNTVVAIAPPASTTATTTTATTSPTPKKPKAKPKAKQTKTAKAKASPKHLRPHRPRHATAADR